jgi:hypothetical protein
MKTMTLEQFRTAAHAGGVTDVTLAGEGSGFYVQIATRAAGRAVLAKARSTSPRRFANPAVAMQTIKNAGIASAKVELAQWSPEQKEITIGREKQAEALRQAHEAAAYVKQLAAEIQEAIDDPAPSIPHDQMLAEMEAELAALERHHGRSPQGKSAVKTIG